METKDRLGLGLAAYHVFINRDGKDDVPSGAMADYVGSFVTEAEANKKVESLAWGCSFGRPRDNPERFDRADVAQTLPDGSLTLTSRRRLHVILQEMED